MVSHSRVSWRVLTSEVHRQVSKTSNWKPQQQKYEMGELEFHQKAAPSALTPAEGNFNTCWARSSAEFKPLVPAHVSGTHKPMQLLHSWELRGSRNSRPLCVSVQLKMPVVGSLLVGNGPHLNVGQENLLLREFSAKNRKVRLKVNSEVPWKKRTKEVPMVRDSSTAE